MRPKLQTLRDLKEKYGPNWGLDVGERKAKPAKPAPTKEELAAHYREYDLGFRPKQKTAAE